MANSDFSFLYGQLGRTKFLDGIGWDSLALEVQVNPEETYEQIENMILKDESTSFILPLSEVTLERKAGIQIAALTDRIESRFHIQNMTETKNLAFLGESPILHYADPLVKEYIKEINPAVALQQIPVHELHKVELAIHSGNQWSDASLDPLHPTEWAPRAGSGIYAILCHQSNERFRKAVAKLHNAESQVLANCERSLLQKCLQLADVIPLGIYSTLDSQANYHLSCILQSSAGLKYHTVTQSTSHGLVQAMFAEIG